MPALPTRAFPAQYEAWENALCDWMEDSEAMLKTYGSRTLHFDSFRDSVFELIDLYTPTTDEKQYVGYMRKLVRQIATVTASGAPAKWRHAWPKASAKNAEGRLLEALRDALADYGPGALRSKHAAWHAARRRAGIRARP